MAVTPYNSSAAKTASPAAVPAEAARTAGVTFRVVCLCLALAVVFGYVIPIIDIKLSNTFLGAAHLPPGAVAVLLILLLVVQPLTVLSSRHKNWSRALVGSFVVAAVLSFALFRLPTVLPVLGGVFALGALFALTQFFVRSRVFGLLTVFMAIASYLAFFVRGFDPLWPWIFVAVGSVSLLSIALTTFGRALSRNEILTVYISCLFSCLVPGHGSENFFVSSMIGPFYFAKAENKWLDFLNQYLPSWFTPALQSGKYSQSSAAHDAVNGWFNGIRIGSETIPWAIWLTPLLMWGSLIFASYMMCACLSVILRAQWSDREALAFPLLRLPIDMTEDTDRTDTYGVIGRIFRNPLLWTGVSIAAFIQLLNGLHLYYPNVPAFPLNIDTSKMFSEPPWNQSGGLSIVAYPIVVGITYLLSSEISFSLWFFHIFFKFQNIIGYYIGFPVDTLPSAIGHTMGAKSFGSFQTVGAFLMYAFLIMWTGREHYKHVARRAFGRARITDEEKTEALSYPVAFWGLVLTFSFLVGWCIFAGISPILSLLMWLTYLVIIICLSRLVVEGGLLFVQQGWTPLGTIAQLFGSTNSFFLPASSLVPASFINGSLMTDLRALVLPSFIQSFKLASDYKIKMKPLMALIVAVIFISFVMGIVMSVKLGYDNGGLTMNGWYANGGAQRPASDAASLMSGIDPKNIGYGNWFWLAFGAALTFLMMLARSRFLWFPFHPLGYLVAITYPLNMLWFSIFLGWLAKVTITRFGGSDTYRKTVPLFLGLALGDIVMMLLWLVVDGITGRGGHQLMPG